MLSVKKRREKVRKSQGILVYVGLRYKERGNIEIIMAKRQIT